jgi:glutaredoxin
MSSLIRVDIYSRPECHLCEEAKEVIDRVRRRYPFSLNLINIDLEPGLVEAYGTEVPVVMINGNKAFKYRVDEVQFEDKVKRLWNK